MNSKRILLIDDDEDDRDLFCEAAAKAAPAFTCYTAVDGPDALAGLRNNQFGSPDVIFLDVNMPVMSGWQVLGFLKGDPAYSQVPVIMYSTSSYEEEVSRAVRSGACCFFTKPHDFIELTRSLELVAQHLQNNSMNMLRDSSPHFLGARV